MKRRSSVRVWVLITVLTGALIATAVVLSEPLSFVFGLRREVAAKKQQVLNQIDHAALADAVRELARERRWSTPPLGEPPEYIRNPEVFLTTPSLRSVKPTAMRLFDDRAEIEFGGALMHFGIIIYRDGIPGHGLKELGPGIWFYSEDGRTR
jgi:hypothetical protein